MRSLPLRSKTVTVATEALLPYASAAFILTPAILHTRQNPYSNVSGNRIIFADSKVSLSASHRFGVSLECVSWSSDHSVSS
jgi:hypothetical protein